MEVNSPQGVLFNILRKCIRVLTDRANNPDLPPFFITSMFTLVQLLASFPAGVEPLVSSGLVRTLVPLIKDLHHLRFSTRMARIMDLLFNSGRLAHTAFTEVSVFELFTKRLQAELEACEDGAKLVRIGSLYREKAAAMRMIVESIINKVLDHAEVAQNKDTSTGNASEDSVLASGTDIPVSMVLDSGDTTENNENSENSANFLGSTFATTSSTPVATSFTRSTCSQERKSFLKVTLRLLVSASREPTFATTTRTLAENSTLLSSLEIIFRSPEYFGTTLWDQAAKWVIEFCNNEPALLPVVQDAGIPDAVYSVLANGIPASMEVLVDLPALLSCLCLNARGLKSFIAAHPLDSISAVFLNKKYLSCINADTPVMLGSLFDELLRHQPTLLQSGVQTVINMLQHLITLGNTPGIVVLTGNGNCK